jgi:hypothetical protein
MPILGPGGPATLPSGQLAFLIQDLENEVLIRCENRTTDTARADVWIRDALLEISGNPDYRDDFPELELFGPIQQLTPKVQEYDEKMFVNTGDVPIVADDILIWVDYPANNVRRKLDVSHYQKTDRFTPIFSLPTEWYRHSGNIGFNPVPDKAYQVQERMVRMHPINDNQLSQTTILLPRDWNEVLVWLAVYRGFSELMEYEKASKVITMLHGDPKDPSQPGLFYSVKRKRRKEQWRMESRLTFTRRPSMWGA